MSKSLLQSSRTWHRKIASALFIFFFIISLTGLMLGWKALFTQIIFDNPNLKPADYHTWMPLDSLEILATHALNEKSGNRFEKAERIELRPAKGFVNFAYPKNYYIQVDGATGAPIHIERKNGSFIQDIHDGAILGNWLGGQTAVTKKIYTTILALALMFLTISGFYLWYKPRQLKKLKTIQ